MELTAGKYGAQEQEGFHFWKISLTLVFSESLRQNNQPTPRTPPPSPLFFFTPLHRLLFAVSFFGGGGGRWGVGARFLLFYRRTAVRSFSGLVQNLECHTIGEGTEPRFVMLPHGTSSAPQTSVTIEKRALTHQHVNLPLACHTGVTK